MKRKSSFFKALNCITLVVMAITTATQSLCFANVSSSPGSEMMTVFSDSMETELGDRVNLLLEKRGLKIDLKNGVSTKALAGEITLVPLTSQKSHQKSQFLAFINHESAGRLLVFLEMAKNKRGKTTSMKIVFPSGRGMVLNINPFYIYQIDATESDISLQDNDDLENTIIVSDTCEVIGIITIVLAAACLISREPIVCGIAVVMEAINEFIC